MFLLRAVVPPGQRRRLLGGGCSEAACTVQHVGWVIHDVTGFFTICSSWTGIKVFVGGYFGAAVEGVDAPKKLLVFKAPMCRICPFLKYCVCGHAL